MLKTGGDVGRVQVYCRSRPFLAREAGDLPAVDMDSEGGTVKVSSAPDVMSCLNETKEVTMERKERLFKMDGVFAEDACQKEVFQQVGLPVLVEVMRGLNGCIFAYGQTGSGKTHSLLNTEVSDMEQVGILPRLVATLYARAAMDKANVYKITAGGFQVYNEQVDDLLHPEYKKGKGQNLNINKGGGIPDLTWTECSSPASLLDAFKRARSGLFYAETKMNKASSRSHAVFQIRITRRQRIRGANGGAQNARTMQATCGQLSVVDLAGSERVKRSGVTGTGFKEATNINGSLLALGNVIQALADKRKFVPFRDSKLTRILEGSVGGNCKTSLLVCVSPAETSTSETLSTLEFASRAMCVEVDAKVNETVIEIDASCLAADMEEPDGPPVVDEEMMRTFKESEQALEKAKARADEQEAAAKSLKVKVNEMETVVQEKDRKLQQTMEANRKQVSQIDLLKASLAEEERKHAQELKVSREVATRLQAQVSTAEREITVTKANLQDLSQKHATEKRNRQEIQKKLETLQLESEAKEAKLKDSLKTMTDGNEALKAELEALTKTIAEDKKKIEEKVLQEQKKAVELEKNITVLEQEKAKLDSNLQKMTKQAESMSQLLALEKDKVGNLSQVQEEVGELSAQLERFRSAEEKLKRDLSTIQTEKLALLEQTKGLEDTCAQLTTQVQEESEARDHLEKEKVQLNSELGEACKELEETKEQLSEMLTKYKEDIEAADAKHLAEIADIEARHKEAEEKRARHAQEAVQALEHRAQQDKLKMDEKLAAQEAYLKARELDYKQALEKNNEEHAQELAASLTKEREAHEKEANMLRQNIKQAIQDRAEAEREALEREKDLDTTLQEKLQHAKAAHEAARCAVENDLAKIQAQYERLNQRFTARESRKEDLALIAHQQKELNDMKRAVKHAAKINEQKQLELEHVIDNVRIFGTPYDGPGGGNTSLLPGRKLGDRTTFLKRKESAPKELAPPIHKSESGENNLMKTTSKGVIESTVPIKSSNLQSSRPNSRIEAQTQLAPSLPQHRPGSTNARARPLPMPPIN